MPMACTMSADLSMSHSNRSTSFCHRPSTPQRLAGGGRMHTTRAAPRQPRKCILRAEMPESDETKTPRPEDDKVKKGRITPEEAKRAQENIKKALNVERVIKFATISPGLTGSIAVLGGLWLHISPYGNLHWSLQDLGVGLACVLPLLLLDAAVMLPNHNKQMGKDIEMAASSLASARAKLQAAKTSSATSGAESSQQAADDRQTGQSGEAAQQTQSVEPSRPANGLAEGKSEASFSGRPAADSQPRSPAGSMARASLAHRLTVSAKFIQSMLLQRGSKTAALPLPVDIGLTAAAKLGSSMLEFAVILTGLSYWERDRMYDLGFPDMMDVLGRSMPLQEVGQWGALAALVAGLLGLAASLQAAQDRSRAQQREKMRSVLGGKARRGVEFKMFQRKLKDSGATEPGAIAAQLQSSLADSATVHRRLDNLLSGTTQSRDTQEKWNAALVTLREIVGLWGVGASFIVTGNLLAPWGAAVATGLLRSGYSRVQLPRLRKQRAELIGKLKDTLGDSLLAKVADAQVTDAIKQVSGILGIIEELDKDADNKK